MLTLGVSGAWADETVTVTTGSASWHANSNGSWTSYTSANWGTEWASAGDKIHITGSISGYINRQVSQIACKDNEANVLSIWTPGNEMITGFSITFTSKEEANCTIASGSSSATSGGTSDTKTLNVSGVYVHYIQLSVSGKWANVSEFSITYSTLPEKSGTGLYFMKANWPANTYLYANSSNAAKIWKNMSVTDESALYADVNYVWRVDEYGDYRTLFNMGSNRYVSNFTAANSTSTSSNDDNLNLLNATEFSDAEVFTLTDRTSVMSGAYAYRAGSKASDCWLDTYSESSDYVGFHNSAHQGNPFLLIPVHKVTFKAADEDGGEIVGTVPVNGTPTNAVYVPANTTLTSISGSKYFIDGVEKTESEVKTAVSTVTDDNLVVYVTPLPTTVTINFKQGDETIATKDLEVNAGFEYDIVTSLGFQSRYMSTSPATVTGTASNQVIDVETTFTLPFNVSSNPVIDETMANVYYLTLNSKYAKGNQLTASLDYVDKDYFWTIGGDYINGFTIYNKGQENYMSNGSTDNAVAAFDGTTTRYMMWSNNDGYFYLKVKDSDKIYLNDRSNTLSTWNGGDYDLIEDLETSSEYEGYYTGNRICVNSVEDDLSEVYSYLVQRTVGNSLGQYAAGDYTNSDKNSACSAGMTAYNEGNAYTVAAAAKPLWAIRNEISGINVPREGQFVYFKSRNNNRYAKAVDTNASNVQMQTSDGDPTVDNIFAFVGNMFVSYSKGRYIVNTRDMAALGIDGDTFEFLESDLPGMYYIKCGTNYMYGYDTGHANIAELDRYSLATAQCRWYIQEVPSLPVTFSGEYASFFSPVDLTIPEGVEVYTGTVNGEWLTLNPVAGTLPANTGVILRRQSEETTTVNFPILSTVNESNTTALTGTVAARTAIDGGVLVLGKNGSDEWGIYNYTGNLGGFKAYMNKPAEVKGLRFDFGTATSIDEVLNETLSKDAVIYNAAGQRLVKLQHGLNIVNGKKVLVK